MTALAVCKGGSSSAFFFGKLLGGPRMARRVSPRKTWAGAVGQVLGSVFAAWVLTYTPWARMGVAAALLYGVLAAAAAMVGDLSASLLKRQAQVKDSGRVLPGMGGVIDMLDDVLFVGALTYAFLWVAESTG